MSSARRLDPDHIVATALALVDDVGRDRFSMRRLGTELGVDPMAVYYYFADQEALFDAVAGALFAEVVRVDLPWDQGWREVCERYAHRLREVLLAHPQVVTIFATRPVRSAAAIDAGNRMMAMMTGAGHSPADALRILRCLGEFVIGHSLAAAVLRLGAQRRSRKPAPGSPAYNLLAEGADTADRGDHFTPGLTALLDGFEGRRKAV